MTFRFGWGGEVQGGHANGGDTTPTYSYNNNRHLVSSINYNVSGDPTGQTAGTPNVSFGYDAAGNRTSMTDGLGSASYGYDSLSRMTSETRTFNGVGSYSLGYSYNLANELTGISNPWGVWVGYGYDNNGRLHDIHANNVPDNVTTLANDIKYRAFGAVKSMTFGDHQTLSTSYDSRMRPTSWNVSNVLGYGYMYLEHTERVNYAQNIYDPTLDRSYEYDQVGALVFSHSGTEARSTFWSQQYPWGTSDGPYSHWYDYDQQGNMTFRFGWGGEVQGGAPYGGDTTLRYGYSTNKNQRDGFNYDAAGNLTLDNIAHYYYVYDATGQQTNAVNQISGYYLNQSYDGDGLRAVKNDNGAMTYYLRSSVLGGAVVAELDGSGNWIRGYYYRGDQLLALQQSGHMYWVHEDAITKSKRTTDVYGAVTSTVELDPWGANTPRSSNSAFQPQNFTGYTRDGNGDSDAKARRYSVTGRFPQPDPSGGSYDFSNPQSLNRYAYVGNDPVNFRDPSGMEMQSSFCGAEYGFGECGSSGFWGGSFGGDVAEYNRTFGRMPRNMVEGLQTYDERLGNALAGNGFFTNDEITRDFKIHYEYDDNGNLHTSFEIEVNVGYRSTYRNFLAGVIDYGIGPPPIPGFTKFTLGRALRLTTDYISRNHADDNSTAYYVGSWVPDVVAVVAGGAAGAQEGGAKIVGPQSPLFRRGGRLAGGALNRNNLLRLGWSWDQTAGRLSIQANSMGRQVFRAAGNWPTHWHFTIFTGPRSW